MDRQQIRDKSGKIIGQRINIGDNAVYLNRNGKTVGLYKKSVDKTFSTRSGFYALGDLGQRLI